VSVSVIKKFFIDLNIELSDLTLGSCSGWENGSYWYFTGNCGGNVTMSVSDVCTVHVDLKIRDDLKN